MFTNLVPYKLPGMDIQELRRANLRRWTQSHSVPPKEKSYFSQLTKGNASFGERAARRLERDYGMGEGYLDTHMDGQMEVFSTPEDALPVGDWPFSGISKGEYQSLANDYKRMIEIVIRALLSAQSERADPRAGIQEAMDKYRRISGERGGDERRHRGDAG